MDIDWRLDGEDDLGENVWLGESVCLHLEDWLDGFAGLVELDGLAGLWMIPP